jgi:hypothetical protein
LGDQSVDDEVGTYEKKVAVLWQEKLEEWTRAYIDRECVSAEMIRWCATVFTSVACTTEKWMASMCCKNIL